MLVASLAIAHLASDQAATYKVVEIARHAAFAGKLGDLVHESLVVERDGKRYTITVRGDYHTRCVRPSQRFHEGEEIRLSGSLSGDTTSIARDRIGRVRG